MSKVFVLIRRNNNENEVVGVFSSRKKAIIAFEKCISKYKPKGNDKVLLKMYQDCIDNLSAEIHGFVVCKVQEFEVQ